MATKRIFATGAVSSASLVFDRFRNAPRETFSMARNARRSVSKASLMIGAARNGRVRDF
jgi:hypothetical protein